MSSTRVEFRGNGFDASDSTLEVWLALLADEIAALEDRPDWLSDALERWDVQATGHFGFGVDPLLDEVASDDARRDMILELSRRAYRRLASWGDPVSATTLNALRDWGPGYAYTADIPAATFRRPAFYFMKLLRGELGPDQTDARRESPEADAELTELG